MKRYIINSIILGLSLTTLADEKVTTLKAIPPDVVKFCHDSQGRIADLNEKWEPRDNIVDKSLPRSHFVKACHENKTDWTIVCEKGEYEYGSPKYYKYVIRKNNSNWEKTEFSRWGQDPPLYCYDSLTELKINPIQDIKFGVELPESAFKTYKSRICGHQIQYPKDWVPWSDDEGSPPIDEAGYVGFAPPYKEGEAQQAFEKGISISCGGVVSEDKYTEQKNNFRDIYKRGGPAGERKRFLEKEIEGKKVELVIRDDFGKDEFRFYLQIDCKDSKSILQSTLSKKYDSNLHNFNDVMEKPIYLESLLNKTQLAMLSSLKCPPVGYKYAESEEYKKQKSAALEAEAEEERQYQENLKKCNAKKEAFLATIKLTDKSKFVDFVDSETGIKFHYPETFNTEYADHVHQWDVPHCHGWSQKVKTIFLTKENEGPRLTKESVESLLSALTAASGKYDYFAIGRYIETIQSKSKDDVLLFKLDRNTPENIGYVLAVQFKPATNKITKALYLFSPSKEMLYEIAKSIEIPGNLSIKNVPDINDGAGIVDVSAEQSMKDSKSDVVIDRLKITYSGNTQTQLSAQPAPQKVKFLSKDISLIPVCTKDCDYLEINRNGIEIFGVNDQELTKENYKLIDEEIQKAFKKRNGDMNAFGFTITGAIKDKVLENAKITDKRKLYAVIADSESTEMKLGPQELQSIRVGVTTVDGASLDTVAISPIDPNFKITEDSDYDVGRGIAKISEEDPEFKNFKKVNFVNDPQNVLFTESEIKKYFDNFGGPQKYEIVEKIDSGSFTKGDISIYRYRLKIKENFEGNKNPNYIRHVEAYFLKTKTDSYVLEPFIAAFTGYYNGIDSIAIGESKNNVFILFGSYNSFEPSLMIKIDQNGSPVSIAAKMGYVD